MPMNENNGVRMSTANAVLFENPTIASDWISCNNRIVPQGPEVVTPPSVIDFISVESLTEARQGKQLACIDIVICARRADGVGVVALSKRKPNNPFGGIWCMYGGSIGAYQDVSSFITDRAEKECGIKVEPQVLLGAYQTSCVGDLPQSTIQLCYAVQVDYDALAATVRIDPSHVDVKLFTRDDLALLSDDLEWYPKRTGILALDNMPM